MDKTLWDCLEDRGMIIFEEPDKDFDLRDYIVDSMDFIQLVLDIEEFFHITFPDEHLNYDILGSFRGLNNLIIELQND